jgi:hypothetical protein
MVAVRARVKLLGRRKMGGYDFVNGFTERAECRIFIKQKSNIVTDEYRYGLGPVGAMPIRLRLQTLACGWLQIVCRRFFTPSAG